MDVKFISRSEATAEEYDYRDKLEIHIDGHRVFRVHDGEPEDSNLGRDFNDVMNIDSLMEQAHAAGLNSEPLNITWEEE